MELLADYNFYILILSLLGVFVSVYSYYVKVSYHKNPSKYRAVCDLSENVSCTRVLTSQYGTGFGLIGKLFGENSAFNVSNSILGALFYTTQMLFTLYNHNEIIQLTSLSFSFVSILGSIYLAYILYFILRDFCIVCNLSYVINGFLFYINLQIYSMNNKETSFV